MIYQGVQRWMVLIVILFQFFRKKTTTFFGLVVNFLEFLKRNCFVVALFDLVHDVEAIHDIC